MSTPSLTDSAKADLREYRTRQLVRGSFLGWCRQAGYEPAAHHCIVISELETLVINLFRALTRGHEVPNECLRLMVMTPPGSAKSTYISKLFPPWFLAQMHRLTLAMREVDKKTEPLGILACSHAADIATDFGRAARNLIVSNERFLGYSLTPDSRAADKWATTNGGYYQAAGVNSGISGRRMHLGSIDDFCGSEQDATSKLYNDQTWIWYENDFVNRLQPIAARVIIANHRNEDDLCGRILTKESAKWRVIKLRLIIENEEQAEDDPLHRKVGDRLWPEYFTQEQVAERMANPRASGIQQQEPSPEIGAFFTRDQLLDYTPEDLQTLEARGYRTYVASDHAVSEKQTADLTCLLPAAFANGILYLLPDIQWDRLGSKKAVEAMLAIARKRKPLYWWAEKGHISKSIGPFLQDRMHETKTYFTVTEVTPVKDKMTRAQTAHGMASSGIIRFPSWLPWAQRAKRELLMFPNGRHDDFVDALSLLCMGVKDFINVGPRKLAVKEELNAPWVPTMKWLKDGQRKKDRGLRIAQRFG